MPSPLLPFSSWCLALVLCSSICAGEVSTKPLRLTKGGTAEHPEVFDGKGLIIDLGTDVTGHAWKKDGEVWTSNGPLEGRKQPVAAGQFTALFVDHTPITLARDSAAERALKGTSKAKEFRYLPASALKPGQMGCLEDGAIYFRWPAGRKPGESKIILPAPGTVSAVTIACSHIIVKNVTAMHAGNDGFNIHNNWLGIRLENIKALCNGDEGISAHEEVQMEVDGAEIAWNGSSDAGVADVGSSSTHYKNCQMHDNWGAAFKFFGKSHSVTDSVIYNQSKDFVLGEKTLFKQERVERR